MLYRSRLVDPLKELAENDPAKVVFISKQGGLSSAKLFSNSKNIAANLSKQGFRSGDVAVMAVEPGLEFIELVYALLMLRARIAIIDPEMGRANYAAKLKQLSPQWMFVDGRLLFLDDFPIAKKIVSKFRNDVPDLTFKIKAKVVRTGKSLPTRRTSIAIQDLKISSEHIHLQNGDPHYDNIIVYTSGTLDIPKGVQHSDLSLSTTISMLRNILSADKNDVVGTYLPHFMLLGIASGLVVKIMPAKMQAQKKLTWIRDQQINILFGPPSEWLPMIIHCERTKTRFPDSIRHLMLGSAPVHQGFLKRLLKVLPESTRITCTYGMTEHLLVAIADGREKVNYSGDGDLLGKIEKNVDLKINDDMEILVKSDQLFTKYHHLNERDEWHATGDLGTIDKQGNLVLMGRKKEMIIRKDFNLYPALYEGTIKKIPGISEAAFVGIYNDEMHDEKVYLAIESENDNLGALEKQLARGEFSIDKQALPDQLVPMKIPRKGRQDKIDRAAIIEYIKENRL